MWRPARSEPWWTYSNGGFNGTTSTPSYTRSVTTQSPSRREAFRSAASTLRPPPSVEGPLTS